MKKTMYLALTAFITLAIISCVPPLDQMNFDKSAQDPDGPKGTYIALQLTDGYVSQYRPGGSQRRARSITADQAISIINYYELIVEKLDETGPGVWERTGVYTADRKKGNGYLAVNVEEGHMYNVLLLAGYMPSDNSAPILLSSGFNRSTAVAMGPNHVDLPMRSLSTSPDTAFAFDLYPAPAAPIKPARSAGLMTLRLPLWDEAASWQAGPAATVKLGNAHALIRAWDENNAVDALPANTGVDQLFTTYPKLRLDCKLVNDQDVANVLERAWAKSLAGTDQFQAAGDGDLAMQWPLDIALDLAKVDCDAVLDFETEYYGYSVNPAANPTAANFRKWRIRNGFINDMDISGNTGGAVFVVFGQGSGSAPSAGNPSIDLDLSYGALGQASIRLISGSTKLLYTLTESSPRADVYEIYWIEDSAGTYDTADKVIEAAIAAGGAHKISVNKSVEMAAEITGLTNTDPSDLKKYKVVVRATKDRYTASNSEIVIQSPMADMVPLRGKTVTSSVAWNSGGLPYTPADYSIAETEVTYKLWYDVKTTVGGYTFANAGREGSAGTNGAAPTGNNQHPVTMISRKDAGVWCNAYSEYMGLDKVYYTDNTWTTPVTNATQANVRNAVPKPGANGFRLPTNGEWEFAARGGSPSTSTPWTYTYAGTSTVGSLGSYAWYNNKTATDEVKGTTPRTANDLGIYDMSGNVWEFVQSFEEVRGGCFKGSATGNGKENVLIGTLADTHQTAALNTVGFRVVKN